MKAFRQSCRLFKLRCCCWANLEFRTLNVDLDRVGPVSPGPARGPLRLIHLRMPIIQSSVSRISLWRASFFSPTDCERIPYYSRYLLTYLPQNTSSQPASQVIGLLSGSIHLLIICYSLVTFPVTPSNSPFICAYCKHVDLLKV